MSALLPPTIEGVSSAVPKCMSALTIVQAAGPSCTLHSTWCTFFESIRQHGVACAESPCLELLAETVQALYSPPNHVLNITAVPVQADVQRPASLQTFWLTPVGPSRPSLVPSLPLQPQAFPRPQLQLWLPQLCMRSSCPAWLLAASTCRLWWGHLGASLQPTGCSATPCSARRQR